MKPSDHSNQPAPLPVDCQHAQLAFNDKQVLRSVDLRIGPGEVVGLLGKNGAGKTTLLRLLTGLLRADAGESRLFGAPSEKLPPEVKERIGYVPQRVQVYPWMRVRQMLAYVGAFYPGWNADLVEMLCDRWQLPLNDRSGKLSVGQTQTLGLIMALGHEPDLLILDEPVASLDPSARRAFLQTLVEVVGGEGDLGSSGRTVLFSTHITSDLERIASRIALLQRGTITLDAQIETLRDQAKRLRLTKRGDATWETKPKAPGMIRNSIEGRLAEVVTTAFTPELPEQLAERYDAEVRAVDLNLEELFLELHAERTTGPNRTQQEAQHA